MIELNNIKLTQEQATLLVVALLETDSLIMNRVQQELDRAEKKNDQELETEVLDYQWDWFTTATELKQKLFADSPFMQQLWKNRIDAKPQLYDLFAAKREMQHDRV